MNQRYYFILYNKLYYWLLLVADNQKSNPKQDYNIKLRGKAILKDMHSVGL